MLLKFAELENKTIIVEQIGSQFGKSKEQQGSLKGLGLRGIGSTAELKCTKDIYGMLLTVSHLIKVNLK